MRKSLFAGITILDADESVIEDDGAFIGRDRETIDRFLEIGAKTHRHSGAAGLSNPATSMGGSAISSGGTIPADLTFSLGFTFEDSDGGETLLSPVVTLATPAPINAPGFAPFASADYSAGDLGVDTYYYAYSFVDDTGGETPVGPTVSAERSPGYINGEIILTGLGQGSGAVDAVGWRLYRAVGGGNLHFLASGTGYGYTDDGSDSVNCDVTPPPDTVNTTGGDSSLLVALPSGVIPDGVETINVYLSTSGEFTGNSLLETFPVSSAGQNALYRSISILPGQPPDVNSSIGGASQIDPDTDILDWHWKRPVSHISQLGYGDLGDVRLNTSTGKLYAMLRTPSGSGASQWTNIGSASGGGGGGGSLLVEGEAGQGDDVIDPTSFLTFEETGDATVEVIDNGGGQAIVRIGATTGAGASGAPGAPGATGATGPQGPVGSAELAVTDEDGPLLDHVHALHFRGSGSASVGVSDLGGGSGLVDIWAPAGGTGPAGAQGAQGAAGPQGAPGSGLGQVGGSAQSPVVRAGDYLEFRASGGINLGVASLGGGSAAVTLAPKGRAWASAAVVALGASASAAIDLTGSAAGGRILEVRSNRQARIRLYGTQADRAADSNRAIGTDPTGDHGLLMEMRTTPADLAWRLTPVVDAHNLDEPPLNKHYLNVTNLDGSTQTVVVAFLYIPTEVV